MLEVGDLHVGLRVVLVLLVQRVPIDRLLLVRLQVPLRHQLLLMERTFVLSIGASSGKALAHSLEGKLIMVAGPSDLELGAAVAPLEEGVLD